MKDKDGLVDMTGTIQPALYSKLIADEKAVQAAIEKMARQIIQRYADREPVFVCLLRGGAPFAADLMKAITRTDPNFHPVLDYMTIKTYGDERTDSGPQLVLDVSPHTSVDGRLVILLDDTLDKGLTAQFAEDHLLTKRGAQSVELIVLVQKNRERKSHKEAALYGFEVEGDVWLTGMGLDDTNIAPEANRWSGFIAVANPEA